MQGIKRKIVHATVYEIIAVCIIAPLFAFIFTKNIESSLSLSICISLIAVGWNILFNTLFEFFEKKWHITQRTFKIRTAHTLLFEMGLILFLVPLFAYWLNISIKEAFITDIVLLVFFMFYTYGYNWVFDKVFGVPV